MIDEIQVRDLALIEEATLVPSRGLTVITGETGAGKTALLSALKLLMGARASAEWVRDGKASLTVSGRFLGLSSSGDNADAHAASYEGVADGKTQDARTAAGIPGAPDASDMPNAPDRHGAAHAANADADAGADAAGNAPEGIAERGALEGVDNAFADETVVTRQVGADGRSRARINGMLASAKEVAALVAPSIDLCGQFEHQALMRPANHRGLLDAWAGETVASARNAYAAAFGVARDAAAEVMRVKEAGALSQAKLDEARFTSRRIAEVAPYEGEYEQLAHDLEIAEHAESLASATSGAHAALSSDGGALDSLYEAASSLEKAGRVDADLADLAESLREAGYILEDVSAQARDYRDRIDFDAESLIQQQERFSLLQGLLRSFGPRMEDVFAAWQEADEVISLVDDSDARLKAAQQRLDQAEEALAVAADSLDAARAEAAPHFAEEVTKVMARLEMGSAHLQCRQERLNREAWTSSGASAIEFLYRPAADMQPRPLARIASGGEVSRVMLACKVVLGAIDDVDTIVFDEVDAGVGGAVAVALADVIADLAKTHQVIVVTHLAQVAVRADTHYVVRREGSHTSIAPVCSDERVDEIARMLSGGATDASLAHARELLAAGGVFDGESGEKGAWPSWRGGDEPGRQNGIESSQQDDVEPDQHEGVISLGEADAAEFQAILDAVDADEVAGEEPFDASMLLDVTDQVFKSDANSKSRMRLGVKLKRRSN